MPLKRGKSRKILDKNLHDLRHGRQFEKTAKKHGKKTAIKQMVAIALQKAGKSRKRAKRGQKPRGKK